MKNTNHRAAQSFLSEESKGELKLGAFYAKTLLDRHQVPRNRRTKVISHVTGLQYGAAHRRARGEAPWTFEELEQLAQHFDETLDQLFFESMMLSATAGEFVIGAFRRACYFWLGNQLSDAAPKGILAAKLIGATWTVAPLGDLPQGGDVFEALRPVLNPNPDLAYRVAVLDDVPEAASAVQSTLVAANMKSEVFHSISDLKSSVNARPYDAYVLDWLIHDGDVRELIGHLRHVDSGAPIFILTGQADAVAGIAPSIAAMELAHGVRYFSKTSEISVMVSMLQVFLNARARVTST